MCAQPMFARVLDLFECTPNTSQDTWGAVLQHFIAYRTEAPPPFLFFSGSSAHVAGACTPFSHAFRRVTVFVDTLQKNKRLQATAQRATAASGGTVAPAKPVSRGKTINDLDLTCDLFGVDRSAPLKKSKQQLVCILSPPSASAWHQYVLSTPLPPVYCIGDRFYILDSSSRCTASVIVSIV